MPKNMDNLLAVQEKGRIYYLMKYKSLSIFF